MKYLLIGAGRSLDICLASELLKAGEEVFCLLPAAQKGHCSVPASAHAYYWDEIRFIDFFTAIRPDAAVFVCPYGVEQTPYLLKESLDCAVRTGTERFVLVSSAKIYGQSQKDVITESTVPAPAELAGREAAQAEYSLQLLADRFESTLTVRLDDFLEPGGDLETSVLAEYLTVLKQQAEIQVDPDDTDQILCLADAARALSLLTASPLQGIYNVASRKKVKKADVFRALKERTQSLISVKTVPGQADRPSKPYIDASRLFGDTEWVEKENPLDILRKPEVQQEQKIPESPKKPLPKAVRQLAEVAVLAVVAGGLSMACSSSAVFSVIDWPMLYVILVSLVYGVRYSMLASCLCALLYLFSEGINPFEMNDFYLLAGNILVIAQYLGTGMLISYFTTMLKNKIYRLREEKKDLGSALSRIRAINQENIFIKEEYEKQILSAQNSYAALYGQFHKLLQTGNAKDMNSAVLQTAMEQFQCTGASLWQLSPLYRPLQCLESLGTTPSPGLVHREEFIRSIQQEEVYAGDPFCNEPSFAIPIRSVRGVDSVLFLHDGRFNNNSLGRINDMKTLGLMVSDIRRLQESAALYKTQSAVMDQAEEETSVPSSLFEIQPVSLHSSSRSSSGREASGNRKSQEGSELRGVPATDSTLMPEEKA